MRETTHILERMMRLAIYIERERGHHTGSGYYDRVWSDDNGVKLDELLAEFDNEMRCADCGKVRDSKKRLAKG